MREPLQERNLRLRYGISLLDYEMMLLTQGGACALCFKRPKRNRLHVDHDHDTGKVRGLLCTSCNTTLGKIDRMPGRVNAIAHYLARTAFRQIDYPVV